MCVCLSVSLSEPSFPSGAAVGGSAQKNSYMGKVTNSCVLLSVSPSLRLSVSLCVSVSLSVCVCAVHIYWREQMAARRSEVHPVPTPYYTRVCATYTQIHRYTDTQIHRYTDTQICTYRRHVLLCSCMRRINRYLPTGSIYICVFNSTYQITYVLCGGRYRSFRDYATKMGCLPPTKGHQGLFSLPLSLYLSLSLSLSLC
eukprot:COSAG03_NODE_8513_length_796_cov_0.704448_1_plen_199_part_01